MWLVHIGSGQPPKAYFCRQSTVPVPIRIRLCGDNVALIASHGTVGHRCLQVPIVRADSPSTGATVSHGVGGWSTVGSISMTPIAGHREQIDAPIDVEFRRNELPQRIDARVANRTIVGVGWMRTHRR